MTCGASAAALGRTRAGADAGLVAAAGAEAGLVAAAGALAGPDGGRNSTRSPGAGVVPTRGIRGRSCTRGATGSQSDAGAVEVVGMFGAISGGSLVSPGGSSGGRGGGG